MEHKDIASRLRSIRKRAGLGLRELGRRADMSAASISAIENGASSPTLATLHKLLKALGTDFADFFSDSGETGAQSVFRPGEMRTIQDAHRRYVLLFAQQRDLRFQMVHEEIAPTERRSEWESHDVDLGGYVLDGGPASLEIEHVGKHALDAGDAFYIRSGQRHRLVNRGKKPLRLITVADPPRY